MNMDMLTSRTHLQRFAREAGASVAPGSMVLDAGAGDSPYRQYFAHATSEATDHCERDAHQYQHVNYACDLTSIPVAANRYHLVLCTQVLEHVLYPREVLKELNRVLKPGGKLWISAPLFFEEHEVPHDFFRYTRYAWDHMLREAGFTIERLDWVSGYFGTLSHQLNTARHSLPSRPSDYGGGVIGWAVAAATLALRPLFLATAYFYSRLDLRHKYTSSGVCMDYCVVATKVNAGNQIADAAQEQ